MPQELLFFAYVSGSVLSAAVWGFVRPKYLWDERRALNAVWWCNSGAIGLFFTELSWLSAIYLIYAWKTGRFTDGTFVRSDLPALRPWTLVTTGVTLGGLVYLLST